VSYGCQWQLLVCLLTTRIGALVLAHSLRDAGTKKKLAVLVTLDSVSAEVVTQLKASFQTSQISPSVYPIAQRLANWQRRSCMTT
jgi:hypothetical protein